MYFFLLNRALLDRLYSPLLFPAKEEQRPSSVFWKSNNRPYSDLQNRSRTSISRREALLHTKPYPTLPTGLPRAAPHRSCRPSMHNTSSLRIVDECHWYSETPRVRGPLGQILSNILRWNAAQWSIVATPLKCAGGGVRFSKWQAVASRNAGRSIKRKSGSDYDSANCCKSTALSLCFLVPPSGTADTGCQATAKTVAM